MLEYFRGVFSEGFGFFKKIFENLDVHCRVLSRLRGLHPLDASSTLRPQRDDKMLQVEENRCTGLRAVWFHSHRMPRGDSRPAVSPETGDGSRGCPQIGTRELFWVMVLLDVFVGGSESPLAENHCTGGH